MSISQCKLWTKSKAALASKRLVIENVATYCKDNCGHVSIIIFGRSLHLFYKRDTGYHNYMYLDKHLKMLLKIQVLVIQLMPSAAENLYIILNITMVL